MTNRIKKIANWFGFIHKSEITEDFLGKEYGKLIGDVTDYSIESKQEQEFFNNLSRIDGVNEFLKATAANDIQRYFAATDEKQRDVVRGAFARTVYFKSKLKKVAENKSDVTKKDRSKATLGGLRYG